MKFIDFISFGAVVYQTSREQRNCSHKIDLKFKDNKVVTFIFETKKDELTLKCLLNDKLRSCKVYTGSDLVTLNNNNDLFINNIIAFMFRWLTNKQMTSNCKSDYIVTEL